MLGIVIASHGPLAEGMVKSAEMFYGSEIPALTYECLKADQGPDEFGKLLEKDIEKVDQGDGVVLLVDVFGGTPANQAAALTDRATVIAGMNFPILLELLGSRQFADEIPDLIETGKSSIISVNAKIQERNEDSLEDFF
jgi:mannose/fructose/sorbose-specific phosphotransferase system IIA component